MRDDVPAKPAAADCATAESDDLIVVGCGWSSEAKRAATKIQPKLEPRVHPANVAAETYSSITQLTTVVEQPRQDVLTTHHGDVNGSSSRRAEPSRTVTVAPFDFDQATAVRIVTSAPRVQPQTVTKLSENNELVVKRGRGRPRKYPPKPTVCKQQTASTLPATAVTTGKVPRLQMSTNSGMRDRLICDKENISPLSSVVVAAKRNANELNRNIWTSDAVRDATSTSKSLQASGVMANKVVERQKLAELPVNVVLSDDNNNFQKRPPEKMSPNFRLKDLDKDKLLSVWNALKGTLQSDDWNAINRKEQTDDTTKCQSAEQLCASTEVTSEKCQEKVENHASERQTKPNEVLQTPVFEAKLSSDTDVPLRQLAAKTVHWKCPEIDNVRRPDNQLPNVEFLDEPFPAETPFPFVDDFDDNLPLSTSLGKPLFTSTPIKLTDVPTSACSAAAVRGKRARVRFRPVTQSGNDDEEDAGDRVELSKLAALPSMQHGAMSSATQISGVRPADIVRAFRTIDNVAAATSTFALRSHGMPSGLPFAVPSTQTNVGTPTNLYQPPIVEKVVNESQPEQPVVKEALSPATMTTASSSNDASPLPSEIVPSQLLHFYGAHHDAPPYNLSPSTGGFVTKAARKRPIVDDLNAPDRKRFLPDVPATTVPAVNTGHITGDVMVPTSVRQTVITTEPPRPEMSRTAVGSQCRRAADMTSRDAVRDVRRAPNGMPVDDLLRLQRKLSTVSDAATLRRVVQIIGETGRYSVNDVTFDFDLCNLDSATVTRLIQCLDADAVAQ